MYWEANMNLLLLPDADHFLEARNVDGFFFSVDINKDIDEEG